MLQAVLTSYRYKKQSTGSLKREIKLKTYLCIILTVAFLPIPAHLRLAHRLKLLALSRVRQNTSYWRHTTATAAKFVGGDGRSNESVVIKFRRNVVIVATIVLEEELL